MKTREIHALHAALFAVLCMVLVLFALIPGKAYANEYNFSDVSGDEWFATDEILGYAIDNGILKGYDDGRFGPYDKVNRGQVAVILHRIAGESKASAETFKDVDYAKYYGEAIMWARSTGVINGYGGNRFGAEDPVTREQLAVMLANYVHLIEGEDVSSDGTLLAKMPDSEKVSTWAKDAIAWALDNSIITGATIGGASYILPADNAQRCAAAKMVAVFHRDVLGSLSDIVDYAAGVKELPGAILEENETSIAATVPSLYSDRVSVGNVIVIGEDDLAAGRAIRVATVSDQGAGRAIVAGTKPAIDEVFDELRISGTEQIGQEGFEPAEGVELLDSELEPMAAVSGSTTLHPIKVKVTSEAPVFEYGPKELNKKQPVKYKGGYKGQITLKTTPTIGYRLSFSRSEGLKEAYVAAVNDVELKATGKANMSGKILLGTTPPVIPVTVKLYLTIGADMSFSISSDYSQTFKVDLSRGVPIPSMTAPVYKGNPQVEASVNGSVGLDVEPNIAVFGIEVVSVEGEVGMNLSVSTTAHLATGNQAGMTCVDMGYYLYGKVTFTVDVGKIFDMDVVWDIFSESNSPFKDSFHAENGVVVPECTWDKEDNTSSGGGGSGASGGDSGASDYAVPDNIVVATDVSKIYDNAGKLIKEFVVPAGKYIRFVYTPEKLVTGKSGWANTGFHYNSTMPQGGKATMRYYEVTPNGEIAFDTGKTGEISSGSPLAEFVYNNDACRTRIVEVYDGYIVIDRIDTYYFNPNPIIEIGDLPS